MFLPDIAIKKLAVAEVYEKTIPELGHENVVRVVDTVKPLDLGNGYIGMITPFCSGQVRVNKRHNVQGLEAPVPSFGISSYGYDVRLSDDIKIFSNLKGGIVDPVEHCDDNFVTADIDTDENGRRFFILPPNSYALGFTLEYFSLPKDVTAICFGKSTYARCGIEINTTVIEPGFQGQVVIEIGNGCSLPVKMYVDGGFAQFMFAKGYDDCEVDYSMGDRKYQGQIGMTYAKG